MTVLPHQRRRRWQIAADRGEVERRHRVDEALERAVLESVPHHVAADRLLLVQLLRVIRIEAPEVDHLRRRVDLRLERVFDWPSIVAAFIVARQVVFNSSAAEEAPPRARATPSSPIPGLPPRPPRSPAGDAPARRRAHCPAHAGGCAASRPAGRSPCESLLPPMTIGMSTCSADICFRRAFSSARSGEPGDRSG
jgi:hypothetical protein